MSTYFVGDIQGCYSELRALLNQVDFDPTQDQLGVAGDMVARGPDSYKTLTYLMSLGQSVKAVLGNHDLHFLATVAGIKKAKKNDLLAGLLAAPDLPQIIHWLRQQPLVRKLPNENVYMSHAGFSPQWKLKNALKYSQFVEERLQSREQSTWLKLMYGNTPNAWHKVSNDEEKFRFIINTYTRMRYCYQNGNLEFDCKLSPNDAPNTVKPWFELTDKHFKQCYWIFGHWAALMGNTDKKNLFALDTGCVWGGHLTLLRWEDKQIFIEQAHKKSS